MSRRDKGAPTASTTKEGGMKNNTFFTLLKSRLSFLGFFSLVVEMDVSDHAIGATLFQDICSISFESQKLVDTEV